MVRTHVLIRLASLLLILNPTLSSAQKSTDSAFQYFSTVGRVLGEVKAIPWMSEICAETFPATKVEIDTALAEWVERNRDATATLESQFDVIQKYWASLPSSDRIGQQTQQQMVDQLNAQRPALKKKLEGGDPNHFKRLCGAYAQVLQSNRLDVEVRWGPQMAIIRGGPW